MRFPATLLAIALLASTAGCAARIVWSPDGTRAAYQNEEHLYVIDDQGNLIERLGPSAGAFAWAPDSTTLYFATPAEQGANTTAVDRDWLPTAPDAVAWRPADTVKGKFTVHRWRDGLRKPLFTLRTDAVVHLTVSPAEKWLAAISSVSESSPDDPRLQLFIYSPADEKLYLASSSCGTAVCFTGPDRLALVEPARPGDRLDKTLGHLVELSFGARPRDPPARTEHLQVVPEKVTMAHALGDQILFTAPPLTFPAVEQSAPSSLHRFDRHSTTLHLLAEDELGAFAVSPDGKRILFGRTVRDGDREFSRLMLMNADGTNPRTLHDFEQEMILIPAWRTADEIVLQGKVDPAALRDEKRDRPLPCDVILYRITDAGLEPLRTLSRTWDERMKPAYSANRPAVAASRPPG